MSRALVVLVLVLVAVACADGGDVSGDRGPERPPPSEPAAGPVVREITLGETQFVLHDEGRDCVALEILHPGLQSTVERRCYDQHNLLSQSNPCGWLVSPPEASEAPVALSVTFECEVELPTVFYGRQVAANVAYLCLGTMEGEDDSERVTGARFLESDDSGYLLEPVGPGELTAAHAFTADGLRHGEPPLDAPSAPIYEACEELAPWGETGIEYLLELIIVADDALRAPRLTLLFDGGLGALGVAGEAFEGDEPVDLPGRLPASSEGVVVTVEREGEPVFSETFAWPSALRSILKSGRGCNTLIPVRFALGATVLDGDRGGVAIDMEPSACAL